jgi:hypothetical protein
MNPTATVPEFTVRQVESIISSLPDGCDKQRSKLLAEILREWASVELLEYLTSESTEARKRLIKELKACNVYASKLSQTLNSLEKTDDLFWIVRAIAAAEKIRLRSGAWQALEHQLQEMRSFLGRLSSASTLSLDLFRRGPGQPRNIAASRVLMDLVEMFEWVIHTKAFRQRHDTGPFWEFATTVWPLIFERGEYGLHSASCNHAN